MIKAIIEIELEKRIIDKWGDGRFGASRDGGKRTHTGIDYLCDPYTAILSPCTGEITKIGYPYGDDLSYRYVEITDNNKARHRLFYVEPDPSIELGDGVSEGDQVGYAQDLTTRYSTPEKGPIPNHMHYEIKVNGVFIDPEKYS